MAGMLRAFDEVADDAAEGLAARSGESSSEDDDDSPYVPVEYPKELRKAVLRSMNAYGFCKGEDGKEAVIEFLDMFAVMDNLSWEGRHMYCYEHFFRYNHGLKVGELAEKLRGIVRRNLQGAGDGEPAAFMNFYRECVKTEEQAPRLGPPTMALLIAYEKPAPAVAPPPAFAPPPMAADAVAALAGAVQAAIPSASELGDAIFRSHGTETFGPAGGLQLEGRRPSRRVPDTVALEWRRQLLVGSHALPAITLPEYRPVLEETVKTAALLGHGSDSHQPRIAMYTEIPFSDTKVGAGAGRKLTLASKDEYRYVFAAWVHALEAAARNVKVLPEQLQVAMGLDSTDGLSARAASNGTAAAGLLAAMERAVFKLDAAHAPVMLQAAQDEISNVFGETLSADAAYTAATVLIVSYKQQTQIAKVQQQGGGGGGDSGSTNTGGGGGGAGPSGAIPTVGADGSQHASRRAAKRANKQATGGAAPGGGGGGGKPPKQPKAPKQPKGQPQAQHPMQAQQQVPQQLVQYGAYPVAMQPGAAGYMAGVPFGMQPPPSGAAPGVLVPAPPAGQPPDAMPPPGICKFIFRGQPCHFGDKCKFKGTTPGHP